MNITLRSLIAKISEATLVLVGAYYILKLTYDIKVSDFMEFVIISAIVIVIAVIAFICCITRASVSEDEKDCGKDAVTPERPTEHEEKRSNNMAKGVIIRSDYCNDNSLQIFQKDDGDIVIRTYICNNTDRNVEIATNQGGSRVNHNTEVIKHFRAIIDLLSDGTEREDIVRII